MIGDGNHNIEALVATMRRLGITTYKTRELELVLGPEPQQPREPVAAEAEPDGPDYTTRYGGSGLAVPDLDEVLAARERLQRGT